MNMKCPPPPPGPMTITHPSCAPEKANRAGVWRALHATRRCSGAAMREGGEVEEGARVSRRPERRARFGAIDWTGGETLGPARGHVAARAQAKALWRVRLAPDPYPGER